MPKIHFLRFIKYIADNIPIIASNKSKPGICGEGTGKIVGLGEGKGVGVIGTYSKGIVCTGVEIGNGVGVRVGVGEVFARH